MKNYSYNELMAMQEEATRRVREMQQRARLTAERARREIGTSPQEIPPKETEKMPEAAVKQIYPNPQEIKPRHIALPSGISENDLNNRNKNIPEIPDDSKKKNHSCEETCPFHSLYNSPVRSLLGSGESTDQSLLLALLLLLGGDGGDELTMLALLYIMG